MYDYHIHSSFSSDCETDMKDTIKRAIDIGLKEICFTDHIDYDYCSPDIDFDFDLDEYDNHISKMRKFYGDKIKILKGVEIGIQPHIIDRCDNLILDNGFDFVISSIHSCDRKDLYNGDFFIERTPREAYTKYLEELIYCAKNFKYFNVIGHLNILIRYNDGVRKEKINDYFEYLEELFRILKDKNKGIEVNTSGFRDNLNDIMPPVEALKLYKEIGGEIITLGSDSHTPYTLALNFDYVYDLLKDLGFKYITTFEGREPKFIKL